MTAVNVTEARANLYKLIDDASVSHKPVGVRVGMNKNCAPKNVCFPSVPPYTDGNPRRSAQSFGRSIMRAKPRAKACVFSQFQIGRN